MSEKKHGLRNLWNGANNIIKKKRMTPEEKEIYDKSFTAHYDEIKHIRIAEMAKEDAERKAKRKFK
jgi:hypothetical protein